MAFQSQALRPVVKQQNGVYAVLLVIPPLAEGDKVKAPSRTLSREPLPA